MSEKRYTIDPANFTDGQWEELYDVSTIMPRTYDERGSAKPFNRPRKYIELTIQVIANEVEEFDQYYLPSPPWAQDLKVVAEKLRELVGPPRPLGKKAARARLYDLLTSDIYTDAEEYEDRVSEIHDLIPIVFK